MRDSAERRPAAIPRRGHGCVEIHFGYAVLLHRDLDRPQEADPRYVRALEPPPDHPRARQFLELLREG